MDYERTTDTDELTEWERADGQFAVRYDQLHQADGGRAYAYETVETREAAEELVADWQADPPA